MKAIKTETIVSRVPFRLDSGVVAQLRARQKWEVVRIPWSCGAESHEGHFACYPLWDEPYLSERFPVYVRLGGGYSEARDWFQVLAIPPGQGQILPKPWRLTVRQIADPEEWR
jgi:hypothetical protein